MALERTTSTGATTPERVRPLYGGCCRAGARVRRSGRRRVVGGCSPAGSTIDLHAGGGGAAITLVDAVARLHGAALAVDYAPSAGLVDCLAGLVEAAYPAAWTDYAGEGETLEHVGWRWLPERTTIWEGVRDVVRTWHGRFWVARWGGPSYRGRAWLQEASEAPALAVGASGGAQDAVPDALDTALDVARVINAAQVVTYPVEQVAAEGVLWESSGVLRLAPGETRTLPALFRDARGERCAAVEVAAPVPQADYRVSELRDGSGVDYTTDPAFDLAVTVEATRPGWRSTDTRPGACTSIFRLRASRCWRRGGGSRAAAAASRLATRTAGRDRSPMHPTRPSGRGWRSTSSGAMARPRSRRGA